MKSEPEYVTGAEMRKALAKQPRRAKKPPRPDIPRAETQERDGLTTLLIAGWSTRTRNGGTEHQLYQAWGRRLETQWHASQGEACAEAKKLQKEHDGQSRS